MQNWNDLIRTQLNNLASFPAKQTWKLGEWTYECHVRPEVANAAALPLANNETGDVRVSLADQAWYIWDGAAWQSMGGGGGGAVNSVTASAPLASSGGANPDISLTGIVAAANGGTGIALTGALGNVLTSNGAGAWTSSAPATTSPAAPLTSVQFNNGGAFGGSAGLTWNGSTLAVDGAVDRVTAGTLTVGGTTATAITIGKVGVTTSFPGPVNLTGDVTTVGGTQFTTDATFDGNVTFGNAATDNISFVGQIDTAITQEGIAAPVVSPASTGRIYFDSGTNTFKASQNGGAYVDVINSAAPGGAVGDVQLNDGVGNFAGSTDLTFASNTLTVTNTVDVTNGANTLTVQPASIGSDAATLTVDAGTTVQVGGVALVNISGAFTLPGGDGANGQVLTTDGAGTAAWQTPAAGTVTGVTATAPLLSSGGAVPDISIDTAGASNGDVLTFNAGAWAAAAPSGGATAQGGANAVQYANATTPADFDGNANFVYDEATGRLGIGTATPNEAATINGVLSLAEGTAPTGTAAFGKLWANSAADARPYWTDDTGQSFNLTLDRFNTLTPAASVAIDTSPALPVFNSLALNQNTTFTTNNLGNGRSASVRVVGDASTRTLTFPVGWTWLGSGVPPADLAAGDVGYLSITAYGATDADVVAAWSYENQPVPVTGTGVDNQISIWSGTNTQDGSANLTFNGTTLGVTGALTQSGGAVALTGNAASSLTTSAGALTLTSAAAATWSTAAGNLAITGGAALQLTAAAGNEVVVNDGSADVDFRVEGDTNTHAIFVQGSDSHVGIGTSNVTGHLFNIGAGASANFAIASGGRIHTYGGAAPANGEVLIGDSGAGNFAKATLTAGSGVSITNGAGSITIAATGAASTSVDIPSTAQEALNAGDFVRFVDDAGTPKVQKADATNADARLNGVGFAVAAASAGAAVTVRVAGVADVPAARFNVAPGVANVGQRVFVSTTSGQITITAPSVSGDILQRVGVLVDGSANPKVLVQVGDPTLL